MFYPLGYWLFIRQKIKCRFEIMTNKKIFNYSRIEIFLIIFYLICWFSISTSFNDILNFTKETIYFNDIINF